ncbi:50S ribosomal protein L32 [Planctomycetes bacterium Pan216]|uniref:Large ribosomal subunit protein bL32 n=1 Tax=Kolteria novifilia TaxID=2527975 RepID=A0A518B4F2_9BACT|nr:50S ribosomal protein L32 [Planctomycetes bacterium Pan216]
MAVPKRRKSHSKTRLGRANKALTKPRFIHCSNCGAATQPHRVCEACGYFQGRVVVSQEEAP